MRNLVAKQPSEKSSSSVLIPIGDLKIELQSDVKRPSQPIKSIRDMPGSSFMKFGRH